MFPCALRKGLNRASRLPLPAGPRRLRRHSEPGDLRRRQPSQAPRKRRSSTGRLFGRVPERTHYLPTARREPRPAAARSVVDQHPRADRVPAGGRRRRRLRRQQVRQRASGPPATTARSLWERQRDPKNERQADRRHRARLPRGRRLRRLPRRRTGRGRREDREDRMWKRNLHAHLESSPLAVDGTLYLGTTRRTSSRCAPPTARCSGRFNSPGAIKASPSYHDGRVFVADYEGSMFCARRRYRQAALAHQHDQGGAVRQGRLLLLAGDRLRPRLRGPRRRHRLRLRRTRPAGSTGPSRPTTSSTARPPSPRSRARRRPSTSAPTTSTSTRSTR